MYKDMPELRFKNRAPSPEEEAQEGLRRAQLEASMSNQFSRGWQSSGLGIGASDLYSQSNLAETEGDMRKAQALRAQADAMSAQAQTWAPRVQNFTDIGSIGDAADWAAGAAGNLRSSIAPMVGGMAGTAVGGLTGLALKNPALGAKIGSAIGSLTPSIQMSRDEIIARAMNNPEAAGRTAEEIRRTGWVGGVPAGLLEAAVPWAVGHGLATAGRKALTNELKKTGVAKAVAKATAIGSGGEAVTEFGQDIIGQTAQNYLARKDLTDYDYVAALNSAAAGAVAGGLMSGGGKMVQAGANRAINRGEQVADTAAQVARNPGQAVGDAIANAGAAAGNAAGWVEGKLEERRNVATAEAALKAMAEGKLGESDQAAVVQGIKDGAYGAADPGIGLMPGDNPSDPQAVSEIDQRSQRNAHIYADRVMNPDYANDFSAEEKAAAARFKAGATDYNQFKTELGVARAKRRARSIAESDFGGSKQSLETTERGTENFALADLWLGQEGEGQKFFNEAGVDGRTLAAQLVEWVRSDFGKEHSDDGSVFIPTRLIDELGVGAAKAVDEITRLVDKQFGAQEKSGLIEVRDQIMQRAKNSTNDTAMITSSLTPLAEARMKSQGAQGMRVLTELLRSSKGEVGAAARKGLEEIFGPNTQRVLDHFLPKNIGRRYGKPGEGMRSPQGQGDGRVVEGIDENGDLILSDEANYDADETSAQGYEAGGLGRDNEREGVTYHGVGESNNPFDTTTQGQQLKTALEGLRGDLSQRTRELGVWRDIRESFKGDERGLRDAEAELIFNYGDFSREAAEAEKMGLSYADPSLDEISSWAPNDKRRLAKLFEIDKRYKILKSEPLGSLADPGKLQTGEGPGTIDSFKYKISRENKEKGVTEADLTAQKGFVFLERKIGDRVSNFPVSLRTLSNKFGHAATAESPVVEGQSGAAALNKQVMSMLSNLIYSGETFTGRVGFRKEAGGPLQWLKQSGRQFVVDGSKNAEPVGLPGETKLGQGKSGAPVTADDARSAAAEARRYGDRESHVPYTESHKERVRILRGLVDAAKAAQQKTVLNTLPTKFAEAALRSGSEKRIGAAYLTLRNQFDGEIDDMGSHNRAGTTSYTTKEGVRVVRTDVEGRTRAISRSNRSADSMLKDERTGKNILASESEASVTTSYRREDPAVKGKADDRVATGALARPLPLELGERLAKYAALFRKSGAMGQAKKGATGKEIADLAEKLLSPKDRSEFQKLRSTRANDLAAKKSWVLKHSTWLPEVPGTIHRDERGAATGLGTDAQFGGYGGKSSPAKSAGPTTEPSATPKHRAQETKNNQLLLTKRQAESAKKMDAADRAAMAQDRLLDILATQGVGGVTKAIGEMLSPANMGELSKGSAQTWLRAMTTGASDIMSMSQEKMLTHMRKAGHRVSREQVADIVADLRRNEAELFASLTSGRETIATPTPTPVAKPELTQAQREDQYLLRLLDSKDARARRDHIDEMSAERLKKLEEIIGRYLDDPETGEFWQRNPELREGFRTGDPDVNDQHRWSQALLLSEIVGNKLDALEDDGTKFSLAADTPHRRTTAGERAVSRATDRAFREQLSAALKTLGFKFDAGAGPIPTTHAARLMDLARKRITSFSSDDKRAIGEAAGAIAYLMMGHKDFADLRQLVNKDHFKQKKAYAARLMSQGLSRGDALTQANTLVVADLIRENFDERNKSPLTKIVEAVKRLLGKLSEVSKTELMETVDRAIDKILSSPEYLKGETKSGFEKVSFEQALSEDPHARNVLETMLKDQGVSLTGSLALSTQGTVYRQKGGLLHDLDFSLLSSGAEPSATKALMEAFPETMVINTFSSSDPYGKITDTRIHVVPPRGLTPSDLRFAGRKLVGYSLRDKAGKVVGTFRVTSDGREVKHGERAMLVDFFIPRDSEKRAAVPHTFTGADGKPITGMMMPAAPTFVAKLSMGRDKDIWDYANYVPHDGDTKFSKEGADNKGMTPEHEQAARDFIKHVLGDSVNLEIKKMLKHGAAGTWTPNRKQGINTIRLAMGSKILGTAYHESLHEFFDMLGKHGAENVKEMLTRAATNPINLGKLERLLHKHPRAVEQLKDPEEALAFTFQYYQMGLLEVGPQTKGVFEQIKKGLRAIASIVSERFREENRKRIAADKDALEMRAVLDQFASGALAEPETRSPLIDSLIENTKAHDEALGHIGDKWAAFTNAAGKLVFSAEAVMKATNSPALRDLVAQFHHEAGTAMTTFNVTDAKNVKGAYLGALRGETNRWMNRLENILNKYEKEDLELARESLSTGKATFAPKAANAAAEITEFYRDMAKYMADSDVRRLEKGRWEKVTSRKDYGITQVWDVNEVVKNRDQFINDLMTHHMDELEAIAEKANAEVDHRRYAGANTASQTMLESGEQDVITPEMVAEAIMVRVINSNGKIDMEEHHSQLGITPVATAVNKRALDWIDQQAFDKYKSKDIANILSTYTRSMVKRAEYQKRFGYSGEQIRQAVDEAILHEIGGKSLVEEAKAQYGKELGSWDGSYDTQPNLRDIGLKLQEKVSGEYPAEALQAAVKKLTPAFKAIQAMEGTLGNDMSPTMRQANSWINTYQSVRLLSTMLFTSINDVMGIVANGGELKDAWGAFASGMREVRNTIAKKKGDNPAGLRAEEWGAVDASSFMDSLGQTYGSTFMTSGAKRVSDTFFKYTGAEGWNRGIRMVAANVGERIITDWAKNGADMKDPAVKARVERLFGEGADPKNIKLDTDGNLDITDPMNQAAVQRWVMDSVVTPTAANRPTWGSDPRFMAMMHLKNYTYTLHRVILKGALDQARLGNYRPLATMMLGYAPVMIGAGAVKEMLIPGDEPYWMKKGLASYLDYGWSTAGVLGVPQMFWHMRKDPAQALGPMADQIQDWLSVPFMDDHTVMKEALKSMPAGTLFRRMA